MLWLRPGLGNSSPRGPDWCHRFAPDNTPDSNNLLIFSLDAMWLISCFCWWKVTNQIRPSRTGVSHPWFTTTHSTTTHTLYNHTLSKTTEKESFLEELERDSEEKWNSRVIGHSATTSFRQIGRLEEALYRQLTWFLPGPSQGLTPSIYRLMITSHTHHPSTDWW